MRLKYSHYVLILAFIALLYICSKSHKRDPDIEVQAGIYFMYFSDKCSCLSVGSDS